MVPTLLRNPAFWTDQENWSGEPFPYETDLQGHIFFQTSGSTGTPKWIALSKTALLISAAAVNRHLEVSENSIWGLPLPTHHVGGFGVVARSYEAGCRLAQFHTRWEPTVFTDWLEKNHITHTSLVPTQVHDLVKANLQAPAGLRAIVVGGGKLNTALGTAARSLGWPVLASYGMTEACSQIATQTLADLSTPYQPAPIEILPIWKTRIEENGCVAISGPALFSGMFIDGIYHPRLSDWHQTSDLADLKNGAIFPLGRADHLVKVLGELVNPEEIVQAILHQSSGELSAQQFTVIPMPDARAEHLLVPVVKTGVSPEKIEKILHRYHASAAGYKRLAKPVFISEFPLSSLGKILRAELIAQVRDKFVN